MYTSQMALVVKSLPANAEDTREVGLILGSGRYPGGRKGNPHQRSYLEHSIDREAWRATVHGVAKNQILLSNLTNLKVKKDYESTHKNDLFFSFIMNYLTKG